MIHAVKFYVKTVSLLVQLQRTKVISFRAGIITQIFIGIALFTG